MTNREISDLDLQYVWHPCTQMKDHEFLPLIPIKKGEGVYLEDFDGNRYIDGISSWWVNLFGHANPYISAKVKEQADTLEHVIMAGFTQEPIINLSRRLIQLTPEKLTRCFYADNGSSAVEAALKMSYHYHKLHGRNKPLFLSLSNSYHGETIGALSVGDVSLYKETYESILIKTLQVKVPKNQSEEAAREAVKNLHSTLLKHHNEISALIVEPLVQCAGGMHMYHPLYLKEAKKLCEAYSVHFIADEIATGFGRTGTMFGFEQAGITPDILCLSKGITGGYLPLSVLITNNHIYETFYDDYTTLKAFLQSHSYTGNALACAAANATLDLFEKHNVIESNREKIAYIQKESEKFKSLPSVREVRQSGMILAIELEGYTFEERVGIQIYQEVLKNGVLLRPLGNVVYFMPPYIITYEEIDTVLDVAYNAICTVIKQ